MISVSSRSLLLSEYKAVCDCACSINILSSGIRGRTIPPLPQKMFPSEALEPISMWPSKTKKAWRLQVDLRWTNHLTSKQDDDYGLDGWPEQSQEALKNQRWKQNRSEFWDMRTQPVVADFEYWDGKPEAKECRPLLKAGKESEFLPAGMSNLWHCHIQSSQSRIIQSSYQRSKKIKVMF